MVHETNALVGSHVQVQNRLISNEALRQGAICR